LEERSVFQILFKETSVIKVPQLLLLKLSQMEYLA